MASRGRVASRTGVQMRGTFAQIKLPVAYSTSVTRQRMIPFGSVLPVKYSALTMALHMVSDRVGQTIEVHAVAMSNFLLDAAIQRVDRSCVADDVPGELPQFGKESPFGFLHRRPNLGFLRIVALHSARLYRVEG
ncbi:hypothetical protein D9M68_100270 [compost metagenome]